MGPFSGYLASLGGTMAQAPVLKRCPLLHVLGPQWLMAVSTNPENSGSWYVGLGYTLRLQSS